MFILCVEKKTKTCNYSLITIGYTISIHVVEHESSNQSGIKTKTKKSNL